MSWLHPARRARLVLAAALALAAACGDNRAAPLDAAPVPEDAARLHDAQPPGDGAPSHTRMDFAIAGCTLVAPEDAGPPACQGPAPLTVQLSAVVPAAVDLYLWEIGDPGDADMDAGPGPGGPTATHVYELPGTYDISLTVRGPGGSATVMRPGAVVVTPAALPAGCRLDARERLAELKARRRVLGLRNTA